MMATETRHSAVPPRQARTLAQTKRPKQAFVGLLPDGMYLGRDGQPTDSVFDAAIVHDPRDLLAEGCIEFRHATVAVADSGYTKASAYSSRDRGAWAVRLWNYHAETDSEDAVVLFGLTDGGLITSKQYSGTTAEVNYRVRRDVADFFDEGGDY